MPKMITFVSNIDWIKLWYISGIIFAFWGGLAGLTVIWPAFDTTYKIINVIGSAVVSGALFAARGGKYVADRSTLPPQDGKP